MKYIVFYDDSCGLCQRSVLFFLKQDKQKQFLFSPLSGKTAQIELKEWLKNHSQVDSIVLVEKEAKKKKTYYYSQAILRMLWLVGGFWSIPGLLSFLPSGLLLPADFIYQQIAKRRRAICRLPDGKIKALHKEYEAQFLP